MTSFVRTVLLEVRVGGAADPTAFAATVSCGFDQRYAEATVRRTGGGGLAIGYWDTVDIAMGTDPGELYGLRFSGYVIPIDNVLFPIENILVCRGKLYLAEFVRNQQSGGTPLCPPRTDPSLPGPGKPDEVQVEEVLAACGLTGDDIQGTGQALGSIFLDLDRVLTPGPFTWAEGESGLDYIQRLDEVSVPPDGSARFRTFEALGGQIVRRPLATEPAGAADFWFEEGVDVLEARITRDPAGSANRVTVTGAPQVGTVPGVGGVGVEVTFSAQARFTVTSLTAPYLPPGVGQITTGLSSPMIEKSTIAEEGDVLSCQQVADFLLRESNTVVDTLTFTTPRDDLLAPGMTVHLHSPRLGLTDPTRHYWLQHLEVTVDETGAFTQRLVCLRKS